MRWMVAFLLFVFAINAPLGAEPLDVRRVPADSKWLVHVDFDALRESTLGQQLLDDMLASGGGGRRFKRLQKSLGVDAASDVQSVTLFDTRFQRHHGLMMIRSDKFDRGQLHNKLMEKHPAAVIVEYRGHRVVTWIQAAGKKHEHEVSGCFHSDETLLISRDMDVLKRTLEVLDGKSESLTADSPLAGPIAAGTILSIRSKGLKTHDVPFRSTLMRKSKRFEMSLGEHDEQVTILAEIDAESSETASNLGKLVEGFRAMGLVRHGSDPAGKRIFDGLTVTVDDVTATATWEMSSEDAEKVMAAVKKRFQHRHHQRHKQKGKKPKAEPSESTSDEKDDDRDS